MTGEYVLYGAKGWGSVIVEAALTLMGAPYRAVDLPHGVWPKDDPQFAKINPLGQVPALVLPPTRPAGRVTPLASQAAPNGGGLGRLMTESGAILLYLTEQHPEAGLAPPPGSPQRAEFLRWMVYVPAQVYPMYWVRDIPSRLAQGEAGEQLIKDRTAARIADCWAMMDAQVAPGRYILGDQLTVLDLYVTVMSRWTPRRKRFYAVAPKLAEVVKRVDADPRLAAFWANRMPFEDGWEG